jgi:hypothetical protein
VKRRGGCCFVVCPSSVAFQKGLAIPD